MALLTTGLTAACGGPCAYDTEPGTCTVTAVEPVTPPVESVCTTDATGSVAITYDFTPNRAAADGSTGARLFVGMGTTYHPPADWASAVGLSVGSHHDCFRKDITRGSCSPVIWGFSAFDIKSDFLSYCAQGR